MKSILLTTTAIVAFAGAAAADGHTSVDFSGSATLGWNSDEFDGEDGFYWSTNLGVAMTSALDNGITAGVAFDIEIDDEGDSNNDQFFSNNDFNLVSSDWLLSLTSEVASLYFGDTSFAAEKHWNSAGDMESDAVSEADGEVVLRGDVMYSGISASVSYMIADTAGDYVQDDGFADGDQLSIGASGSFGMVNFSAVYQAQSDYVSVPTGDYTPFEVYGVSGGVTVAGADITVAYASLTYDGVDEWDSLGIEVAYPVGPVTITGYYVAESSKNFADPDDNYGVSVAYADGPIAVTAKYREEGLNPLQGFGSRTEWNIDGSYDTGLGLTVLAGALNENEGDDVDYYVGGTYALGAGADVLVMYAVDEDTDQGDEIGAGNYLPGTTVEVSFSF